MFASRLTRSLTVLRLAAGVFYQLISARCALTAFEVSFKDVYLLIAHLAAESRSESRESCEMRRDERELG